MEVAPRLSNTTVPVRYDCNGNDPVKNMTVEEVFTDWKAGRHLYEIAFTNENDLAVCFGDVDVSVRQDISAEEFQHGDEEYKVALTTFIGSHDYALASASSYDARKISWRFYIPDLVGTAQAQKEFAENVNKHKGIVLPDGTPVRLDLSVYHVGRKMRMLYAWKQTKCVDGRLETDKRKWENRPLRLVVGREQDTILHRVRDGAERMSSRRLKYDEFDLVRKLVLECLAEDRATDYNSWLKTIWAIRSVENSARGLELAHDFSKKSYKYNSRSVDDAWKQGQDKITAGSIHFWAKADDPVKYADLTAKLPIEFLKKNIAEGDEGLANIFARVYEDTLVAQSGARRMFYAFNSSTGLWVEVPQEYVITVFTGTMKSILTPLAVRLAKEYKDVADNDDGKVLKKKMEETLNLIKSMTMTKTATRCFPQIFTKLLKDADWTNRLNAKADILPVKNGVLELRTGTLRPYELEDYLTYKLDLCFEADADTSKQERFFADVLRNDKEMVEFVQYFLGYCLTGETTRQEFLILEGSLDGANGKSHLISCLQGVMGRLLSTASRKALATREGENNDSLYDARYSRILVVPELNKNSTLDEGMIKTITGTDAVNVSAKYKNSITIVPQFKVFMPLNEMFPVPAEAGAVWRRILLMPFPVRFIKKDSADWDDDLAEQGLLKERDEKFATELKDDRQGWLNWLVQGSIRYYQSPDRLPPQCLQKHLLAKQEENDPYLRFVRTEYIITHGDKDIVPVMEINNACPRRDESDKEIAHRISRAMKKCRVKKGTRDIYPMKREWSADEDGQYREKSVEDKSQKAKATKCWIGLRKKTEEDREQEQE